MANNMIRWVVISGASYDALDTKDTNTLYFVKDRSEIFKGNIPFSSSVILVEKFPTSNIAVGKVYLNINTFESMVYDGTEWRTISKYIPADTNINEDSTDSNLATIGAIKAYVTAAVTGGTEAIVFPSMLNTLEYNKDNKSLIVGTNDNGAISAENIPITGFIDGVSIDSGVLKFNIAGSDTPIEISLPEDNFIKSGVYNSETSEIELTLKDNSVIKISASDLVDIYTVSSTNTVDMHISNNSISADVKVSAETGNALTAKEDGLYVENNVSVGDAEDNTVLVSKSGKVGASDVLIGGETFGTDGKQRLATEAGIKDYLEKNDITGTDENAVHKEDVLTSPSEEPSDIKVLSEKAVIDALSWNIVL